jgi:hypothetical protein
MVMMLGVVDQGWVRDRWLIKRENTGFRVGRQVLGNAFEVVKMVAGFQHELPPYAFERFA